MNYSFQLRGLPNDLGVPQLDYSAESNAGINELSLVDGAPLGSLRYRTGWYAPKNASFLKNIAVASLKHCDGSDLSVAELNDANNGGGMVRVDANSLLGSEIDWNANGLVSGG